MSISYDLTFICDSCGEQYFIGDNPSMPSHWLGVQIMISDKDGQIPDMEENSSIMHFCCRQCFRDYVDSQEFTERTFLVDSDPDIDPDEELL